MKDTNNKSESKIQEIKIGTSSLTENLTIIKIKEIPTRIFCEKLYFEER